ncbi:MAG TPA: MFS transporter [Phycisphaerae bacterium]|nr:MFS transporter [Phycisphaerae bacterium]
MAQAASSDAGGTTAIHPSRLFNGSCMALVAGAAMFAIIGDVMLALKQEFALTNTQIGILVGWSGWGFPLAMFALGAFVDALGMRRLVIFALLCHTAGVALIVGATGFWMIFIGLSLHVLGSGTIEAVCNPLIATVYPDAKTHKLSQFHTWFPGGIVLGGLACYGLTRFGANYWQLKIALVMLPTVLYAVMLLPQHYPATERVQSGVSFSGMIKETLLRPLFLVLLVCMMLTASLELGPNRWLPSVLTAGGIPGILVLVWITGLMAVLRMFAGPVVKVTTDTGLLLLSAVVAGVGLLMLSYATSIWMAGVAATVFALGVCYFWPTMLGVVAERVPKGGAFALGVIGGAGGLFVGFVATPAMGWIADVYLHRELVETVTVDGRTVDRAAETRRVVAEVEQTYAAWADSLGTGRLEQVTADNAREAVAAVRNVLDAAKTSGTLPEGDTATALRLALDTGPMGKAEDAASDAQRAAIEAKACAAAILLPADNAGGLMSFRYVAPLSIVLLVIFGVMFIRDRRRRKTASPAADNPPPT